MSRSDDGGFGCLAPVLLVVLALAVASWMSRVEEHLDNIERNCVTQGVKS